MGKIDNLESKVKFLENTLNCLKKSTNNNNNNIQKEQKLCLNSYNSFIPADVNNPTTEEVQAWVEDNLTQEQKNNGTVLTYFVDDYIPFQNNLEFYFSYGAENSTIDYFTINSNSIISNPIPIKVDGEYVYDGSFETIVENWLLTNGFEGDVILDLDNQVLILQHIRGGNIDAVYGYSEDGDSYEDNYTSYETVLISGNGGTCNEPDFTWTLNDLGKITLDYKRTFNTKTVYVDAGSGSDVTGKRGYRNFPFKTLNAAIPECKSGDTLYVFPGDYTSLVTVTKLFNIYCEIGVNWDMQTRLTSITTDYNNTNNIKWYFDYLYKTGSMLLWHRTINTNNLDVYINTLENIRFGGGFNLATVKVNNLINATIMGSTLDSNMDNSLVNIDINNLILNGYKGQSCPVHIALKDNTILNASIANINVIGDSGLDGGIFNFGFGNDIGKNKNINFKAENVRFYPNTMYANTPTPHWYSMNGTPGNGGDPNCITPYYFAGLSAIGNQVFWVRNGFIDGSILNAELKNYRGTGHGFMMYGWHFDTPMSSPTEQRIVNVKLQGYWEKGIPVSLHWFGGLGCTNCPQNTIVNIDLDVICDTSMGVAFWCSGGIHESNRFNISGKIVCKGIGMPCITLSSICGTSIETNNTISLKDLIMINDGTVPSLMINPLNEQVQNVQIQNVKSNSLIVDANITEMGESIVRNVNYK